ncbi:MULTISPECIES: glycosyltransferase [unclassified Nocardia]|uniref:glycosyltransferase n=1 Tax=unclassified Nocardia TaxID=2637762 RepID=UPI001CE43535|nr:MULTISPECIES: glycosyltransferase [unclassified Nocardia]
MRVLCTITGSVGHLNSVLPLARAVTAAGHEVEFACTAELAPRLDGAADVVHPVLPGMDQVLAPLIELLCGRMTLDPQVMAGFGTPAGQITWVATGPHLVDAFRRLLPIAERFRPDLLIRDGGELSGCLLAEALDIPHISAPSGDGNILEPERVRDPLNERRAELGLPARFDPFAIFPFGRFDCVPPEYSFATFPGPNPIAYRQPSLNEHQVLLPDIADLPPERPFVVAAVGSEFPLMESAEQAGVDLGDELRNPALTIGAVAQALSELESHAVVSTGGITADKVGGGTDNVRVVEWMSQPLLLECAQLFVTHGGYNSIREAMASGTPMVVLPQYGDNLTNADLVERYGLGLRVNDRSPSAIAEACRKVLTDVRFGDRMRQVRRAMSALPEVADMVPRLEALAGARTH